MPICCTDTYAFFSENEGQLRDFFSKLQKYSKEQRLSKRRGVGYLGDILYGFNLDFEHISCSGKIIHISEEMPSKNHFYLTTTTEWIPANKVWDAILHTYYPDVKYVFETDKCDCMVFETTDKTGRFFRNKFAVIYCKDGEINTKKFTDKESLISEFNVLLTKANLPVKQFSTFSEVMEAMEDKKDFLCIREYEIL